MNFTSPRVRATFKALKSPSTMKSFSGKTPPHGFDQFNPIFTREIPHSKSWARMEESRDFHID